MASGSSSGCTSSLEASTFRDHRILLTFSETVTGLWVSLGTASMGDGGQRQAVTMLPQGPAR
jgi:hypothetical protein